MLTEFNRDGTVITANNNFLEAMGYSLEEIVGKHHRMFVEPEFSESDEYRAFWETLNRGQYVSAELSRRGKGGREVWIQASYNPILGLDGKPFKIVENATDVTERVTATKELEVTQQELIEQTAYANALAAEAESANQSKSEFLANMSHEIRTPMTAILGFTDILLDDVVKPEDIDAARTVKENGHYLLNLINDILDLSKIESGKLDVDQIETSPRQVIADVASLMRVRAKSKVLSLDVQFDGPIPERICSDPTRLRQVLINIVGNTIKFTETGSINIVTRLLEQPGEEPKLRFDVIDTGIGIPADKVETIFKPFTQADGSCACGKHAKPSFC